MERRRFKQSDTLEERLSSEAERLRRLAAEAPEVADKQALLRRAKQYDVATQMDGYLRSSDLKPPT